MISKSIEAPFEETWNHEKTIVASRVTCKRDTRLHQRIRLALKPIQHVACQPQDIAFAKPMTIQSKIKPMITRPAMKNPAGRMLYKSDTEKSEAD